ncbi:hypothetical protein [Piscinibacter sp. XHJ-5]|uniref:hypothetical protein n=1 Tax=Piscinibacter sp. XHJ-5 TaxID=3037797 RepID=UPI0024528C86|nr:hypothetical protein [Piscinibacter sp. XHJ-5]
MGLLHSTLQPTHQSPARAGWLLAITLVAAAALWRHGPIVQWADYHRFADARAWLSMPNAANVLSNLPFLLAGAWGLGRLARDDDFGPAHRAWRAFAAAVLCTAFGSAAYHWAPSNQTLAFDRLPIACACASLLCALLAERVDRRWSSTPALGGALLLAALSVATWRINGDLRLYAAVQFLPMLLLPAALALRLPPTHERVVPARAWCAVLVLYALAKLLESADHAVMESLSLLSGHTLKHLLAAAAAAWMLRAAVSSGSRR